MDMSYIANEIVNIGVLFAREKWLELRQRLIAAVKSGQIDPQLYEMVSVPLAIALVCCCFLDANDLVR